VRYVLEGSVRRTGKRVRISTQLIDGQSGADLWAENIDGTIEDVLDFQDRVTEKVVGLIEPRIREVEIERVRRKRPESLDAYDLYLQALPRYHRGAMRVEDYDELIDLLHRAIALDPTFAPALALCAWHHEKRLTRNGTAPPGIDDAREALQLADRALAADGADAFVLLVAGVVRLTVVRDEEAGFDLIMRALAINPNSFIILNTAGYAHFHRGNYEESIACNMSALELSPGSPDNFWSFDGLARAFLAAGRFEEALTWGLRGREATTALDFSYCVVAAALAHLGRLDDAREAVAAARAIWPELTIMRLVGHYGQPREYDRLLADGLRKAGLPEA
jgi:hypothetical protein